MSGGQRGGRETLETGGVLRMFFCRPAREGPGQNGQKKKKKEETDNLVLL